MGELIVLSQRPRAVSPTRPAFFFDPASPFSYLAAERVERILGEVDWVPAPGSGPAGRPPRPAAVAGVRAAAERHATELRLPLVWPEHHPAPVVGALRAAAYASEIGAAAAFALAAMRMAFCGGYDLDDPEILAEAAAASGLAPEACLDAAADSCRDEGLSDTAERLRMHGLHGVPAIWLGTALRDAEAVFAERLLAPPA